MNTQRTLQTEYIKFIFLSHVLNRVNDDLRNSPAYKYKLKNKINLMLKEVYPEAKAAINILNGENAELGKEVEMQIRRLSDLVSILSLEELVNYNVILSQYQADKYNITIRIPLGRFKKFFKGIAQSAIKFLDDVSNRIKNLIK